MAFDTIKAFARRFRGMSKNLLHEVPEIAKSESAEAVRMMESIDLWQNMHRGAPPWIKDDDPSLEIPSQIAAEVAGSVTVEMDVEIQGSPLADFIAETFKPVLKDAQDTIENVCAGGGYVLKPCPAGDKITVEMVKPDAFWPTAYTNDRKITGAYFIYRYFEGRKVYTRLEKHELLGDRYVITNTCYMSASADTLGRACPLTAVDRWADIEPEVTIDDLDTPLFAYIRMPLANTIDPESPLGVSIYHKAVKTIRDADRQYQSLLWEYQGGELAIDVTEDAFKKRGGKPELPQGKERLYRTNELDAATTKETEIFKEWAPELRDANYMSGLNKILIQIENQCLLSRGIISDPNEVEKTATEYRIMKQRYARLVYKIQGSYEDALRDLAAAVAALAHLYGLAPDGEYNMVFTWDDSILVDSEAERMRDLQEVRDGIMKKWEYRMKWYGEDEATAKMMVESGADLTDDELLAFNESNPAQEPNPAAGAVLQE